MITPCLRPLLLFVLLVTGHIGLSAEKGYDLASLERSFWLHASLAAKSQRGYWGPAFPAFPSPTETDIRNAARLLTDTYAANRLYLVYHHEIPLADAEQVFRWWRQHCPEKVHTRPHARPADVRPAADPGLHAGRTHPSRRILPAVDQRRATGSSTMSTPIGTRASH